MDWLTGMNRALDCIEEHLDGELDYAALAQAACCPPGLFQRIFVVLSGLPLSEYIRRRRLTRAAYDLCATQRKVIDIALKYGYDSPDAFATAFKRLHNVSPSAAREQGILLTAYPRLSFTVTVKGDIAMHYRIEQRPAFQVTGKVLLTSNDGNANLRSIPQFWDDCRRDGTLAALETLEGNDVTFTNLLGVCYGAQADGVFSYMVGAGTHGQAAPGGMQALEVPAGTWAVFASVGPMPHAIQEVWRRIMGEFLPSSDYRHAGTPDFELYYPGENDENYRSEVWIPVLPK